MGRPGSGDIRRDGVLIVGAGIAGLTAAIILAGAGVPVTLVERDAEMRGGGFLVSLSGEAFEVARRLDLLPALEAGLHRITRSSYHDASGRRLLALDYRKLFGSLDVIQPMRNDLAKALLGRLPDGVDLRRGVTVERLSQTDEGVEVSLRDGSHHAPAAVLGADGVHSATRATAFGDDAPSFHDLGLFCAAYRLENTLGLDREFRTYMERDRYMAVFDTAPNEAGAVFVWAEESAAPPGDGPGRAALLRGAFQGAPEATTRALAHAPTDRAFYMDRLKQVELARWHSGRVALTGDAAHCLTLFSGRGAAAALAGGARLADALLAHPEDPQRAFAAVEATAKPHLDAMQKATRAAVKWYVPRRASVESARNTAMRLLPSAVFERYFQAKYRAV